MNEQGKQDSTSQAASSSVPKTTNPLDEEETLMQGIHPVKPDTDKAGLEDVPNSAPATSASVAEVAAIASQIQGVVAQIEETASQIQVAQEAAVIVSKSADQLHQAAQKIAEAADQIKGAQEIPNDASTPASASAETELPPQLTEEAIDAIVEKKVEAAITAATATPTGPEKEPVPIATPITTETAQAIGAAVAAAITATAETSILPPDAQQPQNLVTPAVAIPQNKKISKHLTRQEWLIISLMILIIVSLVAAIFILPAMRANRLQPQTPATMTAPAKSEASSPIIPFAIDSPLIAADDYNSVVQRQISYLRSKTVKESIMDKMKSSSRVDKAIQDNIDSLLRKGSSKPDAVINSYLAENVVEAILGELDAEQQMVPGIRDMIKKELETVSKCAEEHRKEIF